MERNCCYGVRFWAWWTAAFCRRGVAETVSRGRPQSSSLRVLEVCRSSRVGRLQPIAFSAAAVCSCPWQWKQRTRWWWKRWGWTQWRLCRSAPSLSLAGWISSAAVGSTSSVVLFWWGSWCPAGVNAPNVAALPVASSTSVATDRKHYLGTSVALGGFLSFVTAIAALQHLVALYQFRRTAYRIIQFIERLCLNCQRGRKEQWFLTRDFHQEHVLSSLGSSRT